MVRMSRRYARLAAGHHPPLWRPLFKGQRPDCLRYRQMGRLDLRGLQGSTAHTLNFTGQVSREIPLQDNPGVWIRMEVTLQRPGEPSDVADWFYCHRIYVSHGAA